MTVAKVIEISAESNESLEDAIRRGVETAGKSVRHIKGAWVKEQPVVVENDKITKFRVDMMITFVLE